jgi:hypothetical protein
MTRTSSGLAYVLALLGAWQLAVRLRFGVGWQTLLTASMALGTTALPYARHVNNHIFLLAVTAWLTVEVVGLRGPVSLMSALRMGLLAGLGYTIDLGAGPVFLATTAVLILRRCGIISGLVFGLAALPWLAFHHALNYAVGGCWQPANALPEHFHWPGSPFNAGNLTGGWVHSSFGSFLLYAGSMLVGKRGFLGHNLPLFLLLPVAVLLPRRRGQRPEVLWALACCGGVWLLYAATSKNSSGQCLSIRWFLPLLAPAYFLIARLVRRSRQYRLPFLVLSAAGGVLLLGMEDGPWSGRMVSWFWTIQGVALTTAMIAHRARDASIRQSGPPKWTHETHQRRRDGRAFRQAVPGVGGEAQHALDGPRV